MTVETPVSVDQQLSQLQRIWVDCFRSVLGQVAGFPVNVEPAEGEGSTPKPVTPDKPPASMGISVSKALQGDMAIWTSEACALSLAQLLMSEQLNAAVPFDQEHRDAYEELLRQVLGQVATGLKQVAGGDVEVKHSGNEVPSWTDARRLWIRIMGGKLQPVHMTMLVSAELAKSVQALPEAKSPPPQKTEPVAAQKIEASPAAPPAARAVPAAPPEPEPSVPRGSNMELLLDVRLDATIRFGQRRMLLREILELQPGTAVALDRLVHEPVELLVGGRVVAQGEVVIVDGNYGLRITEILTPQQRIESLGKQR